MPTKTARILLERDGGETGLLFRAETDNGFSFVIDSGEGAVAAGPVDLLIASLGACGAMDVIGILKKKRQQVTAYAVDLVGERREEHPRAFTKIEIVHRLTGRNLSPAAIEEAIRLSDTKYCSVQASLMPQVEITSRYEITAV
ncbi:MAG: OsmC family protein [Candidatus Eiseniibacteriota bacterium]